MRDSDSPAPVMIRAVLAVVLAVVACTVTDARSAEDLARSIYRDLPGVAHACPQELLRLRAAVCKRFDVKPKAVKRAIDALVRKRVGDHSLFRWDNSGGWRRRQLNVGLTRITIVMNPKESLVAVTHPRECKRPPESSYRPRIDPPKLVPETQTKPKYPVHARYMPMEGAVTLIGRYRADGFLEDLCVLRSDRPAWGFEDAALDAVADWRFELSDNWVGERGKVVAYFEIRKR